MEAMEWDGDGASSVSTDGTMDDDRGRAVGGDTGARPPAASAGGAVAAPRRVPPLPRLPLPAAAPRRAPSAAPTGAAAAATTLADLFPLAGTHDSGAYVIDAHRVSRAAATLPPLHLRWVRWALRDVLRDFSRTQRLTIYEQLVAGARFLDIRVSKLTPAAADDRLWVVHGAAACVPLADVVAQINAFHARAASPTHVILAVRHFRLSAAEAAALATQLNDTLTHPLFRGDAPMLAATPLTDLPVNIVAGVAGVSKLGPGWAVDDWINTYCGERKLAGLHRQLAAAVAGAAAASSLSCAPAAAVDERLACLDALPPSPRPVAAPAVGAPLPPSSTLTSSPSSVRSSPGGSPGGSPPPSRPPSPPLGGRPRRASAPTGVAHVELSAAAPAPRFTPAPPPTAALAARASAPAPAARTVTPAPLGPSPEAAAAAARLDALFVLGWTVTPHPTDIAMRIASVGRVRPSLITEASRFNARLSPFLADHAPTVGAVVHVLFFDFFSPSIAAAVARVRLERAAGGWSVGEADTSPSTLLDTAAALEKEAPPPPSPRVVSWGRRLLARLRWR